MATFPQCLQRLRRLLPVLAALLAISLRVLLPALHDHGPGHRHAPGEVCTAHATCSCGHPHAPAQPKALAQHFDGEHVCAACELELSTPGSPVPPPTMAAGPRTVRAPPATAPPSPTTAHLAAPAARGPPAGSQPFQPVDLRPPTVRA